MKKVNRLMELPFFQDAAPETVEHLWAGGSVRKCKKGEILIQARVPVDALYFQLSGKSFLYTLTHSGQRKIHFIYGKGALLNQNTIDHSVCSNYCEMLEPSEVFVIPAAVFRHCMMEDFALTRALLSAQERKIWRLMHQQKNTISSVYTERKLAAKLWKLCRDFDVETENGIEIDMNLSVVFLADMLGVPRETVSRLRSTLISAGLISVNRKRITVCDPERMAHFYRTGVIDDPAQDSEEL